MAGRRNVFEKHVKSGHDFAWEGRWSKAIEQYTLALAEFPEDAAALVALAQAHTEMGDLQKAVEAYRTVARLTPKDPLPLVRLAELEVQRGSTASAVEAYMALAEVYRSAEDLRQAGSAWEQAVRLAPDHIPARQRLAGVYAQLRATDKAVEQHLAIAEILQRMGQEEKAIQQCREALHLSPTNSAARNMMDALRGGGKVETPPPDEKKESEAAVEERLTPADETQRKALSELAGALFEERARPVGEEVPIAETTLASADTLIGQAIDFQTRGRVDEAVSSYLKLLRMGEDRPAIHFNLGLLLQQQLRFEEAIAHLQQSVKHPEYRLGSHFALGQCYRTQGQVETSLEHFLEVIKIVDLETVGRDQADDLIHLYANLAESYRASGDWEKARGFSDSLVEFLSGKGWQDKVREARARLDAAGAGVTVSLAELLGIPEPEEILRALSLSQEYYKRGLLTAASDECYRAMERAPWYLPAHLRLADVWLEGGDLHNAAAKYRIVGDVYALRGEPRRAVTVYRRLLSMNPADTEARKVCMELLKEQGDYEDALEEYIAQIEMLARIAQVDKALQLAEEAQALIREKGLAARWRAAVLHQIGAIQVSRVEWKAALETYREIKALSPADERARVRTVDLHYKLAQDQAATAELDELLTLYRQRGEHQRAISILRELVDLRPQAVEFHRRLAEAYQAAGAVPDAVQEWDMVSRILWNDGEMEEAKRVIREIIRLNPENVQTYRARLQQMGG